jgi:hypothetical protein
MFFMEVSVIAHDDRRRCAEFRRGIARHDRRFVFQWRLEAGVLRFAGAET